MYSCKLTIIGVDTNGDSASKDLNGVNQQYIGNLGIPYSAQPTPEDIAITGITLPQGYSTFWEWADAVARGINSLTTNTYVNCRVQAVFDVNQEVTG